ncbi:MAG: RNA 3'-terminal phosphate cyclase [Candidatus Aenigmarchaeota archaeon]|nr:RNA 3'-terminal phosphate cyclase [Candidatus Aenigmarchaeota archaeon]
MLEIDGSYHEGGGQILRTAVALSSVTGRPVRIINIRAKRCNPGLSAQHLTAIKALARLSRARLSGAKPGSTKIEFFPGEFVGRRHEIDIGTAGAISLVLQTLTFPAVFCGKEMSFAIKGGTHVRWSPPMDYFTDIFCFFLEKLGIAIKAEVKKYGFYPKGGGFVEVSIKPTEKLKKAEFTERGKIQSIKTKSIATEGLRGAHVAERQADAFENAFNEKEAQAETSYIHSLSDGSHIFTGIFYENAAIGAGALGERGRPAEKVGQEAAETIKKQMDAGACLDEWMADQILPYLALSGGTVSVAKITPHAMTNIHVIEQFFGKIFHVNQKQRTISVLEPAKLRSKG